MPLKPKPNRARKFLAKTQRSPRELDGKPNLYNWAWAPRRSFGLFACLPPRASASSAVEPPSDEHGL